MRQGAFVVDKVNSPLWTAAKAHAKKVNGTLVAATSFRSPRRLAEQLARTRPAFIIFSWREALDALISDAVSTSKLLRWNPTVHLLVPDHLGLDRFPEEEKRRALAVDSVLVTSKILQEAYAESLGIEAALLHDWPDVDLIQELGNKNYTHDLHRLIWVGNSKWGNRIGFQDHKGLKTFALPALKKLKQIKPDVDWLIIDSAKRKKSKRKVLEAIRESCCILITSDSEGTSLPLLEAMALGTPPVTFRVGVAPEILKKSLSDQVTSREVELIVAQVVKTLEHEELIGRTCSRNWLEYVKTFENEIIKIAAISSKTGIWRTQIPAKRRRLLWFFRWMRQLVTV